MNSIQEVKLSIRLFVNVFYVKPGLNMQKHLQERISILLVVLFSLEH